MDSKTLHRLFEEFVDYAEVRHLAYNVANLQQEKMFRSLAILSFLPAEGKTLLCAALAMAYSEASRSQVLVVDTTSVQNPGALRLKECFNGSAPLVEVRSLKQIKNRPLTSGAGSTSASVREPQSVSVESPVVYDKPLPLTVNRENDFSLIKEVVEEHSKSYGLVLFDTMPLQVRNKGNVDPLLVARLSDAAVLVMSRASLESPKLSASLKRLNDPALNLIGIISNEEITA